jgi:hypothetical protein
MPMPPESRATFCLEPDDEFMHANTGEPHFNESMYFNFFDGSEQLGGFVRIGNRPNESRAEVTVCLFQRDGTALFQFQRPPISGNEAFDAGGMRFRVEKPFERLRVSYTGEACRLRDPLAMAEPRSAFASNPFVPVQLEAEVRGIGPMYGGEGLGGGASGGLEFARGHYEQHHRTLGWVEISGERTPVDGFGLRDHSWGPRSWQSPACYRWLTASFGEDLGFMGSLVTRRDGGEIRGGFIHRGRQLILVRDLEIDTDVVGRERYHDRIRARLHGEDGRVLEVEGRVLSLIPLRHRRDAQVTRISEGMTEWRCEGRTGHGLSEYLDQVS